MKNRRGARRMTARAFVGISCLCASLAGFASCATASDKAAQAAQAAPEAAQVAPAPPVVLVAFEDSGQDLGRGAGRQALLGDVDGDGDIDALLCTSDAPSALSLNDGKGRFSRSPQVFDPGTGAAMGDLDGDGHPDLFFTEGETDQVWLNDGKGSFTRSGPKLASSDSAAVALGDLDGDGDLDAFVATWSNQPDQVFLNDGHGAFVDSGQRLGTFSGSSVVLGDVDRDGDPDAVVSNNGEESGNSTMLWLNDGKGNFTDSGRRLGPSNASAVALGDLDGDGDLDAFIANSSHGGAPPADKVWLNDGHGVFSDSGQELGVLYSLSVTLGDFDGDGDLDAFTGSWRTAPRVWLNDGHGRFTDSGARLVSPNASSEAVADLDGDGSRDLFVAANTWAGGDGRARLWFNRPVPRK